MQPRRNGLSFGKPQFKYRLCHFLILASGKAFYFFELQSSPLQNRAGSSAYPARWLGEVRKVGVPAAHGRY